MLRQIYLCIGGNLGEREANLEETIDFIDINFGDVLAVSSVYESEPWRMQDVPNFLNQVVHIQSELSNDQLLAEIAELEEFFGRDRSADGYVSREMDVDVLFIAALPRYFDDFGSIDRYEKCVVSEENEAIRVLQLSHLDFCFIFFLLILQQHSSDGIRLGTDFTIESEK